MQGCGRTGELETRGWPPTQSTSPVARPTQVNAPLFPDKNALENSIIPTVEGE